MDISKGRYWNRGVQLVDGCTPCSPGCEHCWSASLAHRFKREGEPGHDSGILTGKDGKFNGDVITCPECLSFFAKTRKPTVFAIWNDLFHEDVPFNFVHEAYDAMKSSYKHTYLVLTKRPKRMLETTDLIRRKEALANANGWFEHILHGLTVCNQQEADEKMPIFLQVQGKKYLSIEPMLSKINIEMALEEFQPLNPDLSRKPSPISAVLLGCETGPSARPMHPDWAENVVNQCNLAGVPLFIKQIHINEKVSKDINEWPANLRVRQLPWINHN